VPFSKVLLLRSNVFIVLHQNNPTLNTISILGCGWLGQAAAKHLLASGYLVKGSTTSENKLAQLSLIGIEPHLLKLDPAPTGPTINSFFSSDVLLVTIPPKRKSGLTDQYLEQITQLNIFLRNSPVQYVIFISSTTVYHDIPMIVKEGDADQDSYLFQAEKLFIENTSVRTTVLRFGGLLGNDRHPGKFLAGKTEVSGARHPVNLIHQEDCVKIIALLVKNQVWNEVFNACCDVHVTREQFYFAAARQLALPPPVFKNDWSSSKTVNSDKVKTALGFQFSNHLVEAYMKH
jgi:nucleoside-diphosphate-sugar epimerase